MRGRHGPSRCAGTGLDDDTVAEIIIAVVAQYGGLDIDACVAALRAERDRRRWGPRLRLVEPWAGMREVVPTGASKPCILSKVFPGLPDAFCVARSIRSGAARAVGTV